MRPPPSEGVWYSPSTGTFSTTAVSCFKTSRPRNLRMSDNNKTIKKTREHLAGLHGYSSDVRCMITAGAVYLDPLRSEQWQSHPQENEQCCTQRHNTLKCDKRVYIIEIEFRQTLKQSTQYCVFNRNLCNVTASYCHDLPLWSLPHTDRHWRPYPTLRSGHSRLAR